ncbi:MAG TPA: protein translocase subunit SecD [Pirellulaceae bacterium]|nr:protein translocase subunit SecD [Pirellulaceae bacterium]
MNHSLIGGVLLAQAAETVEATVESVAWYREPFVAFLIIAASAAICFAAAWSYTKAIRMKDHWWRLGLTLACFVVAVELIALGWPPRLGVDLKGGVVFIAELAPAAEGEAVDPADLVPRLKERVDPTNTKEIMIRPYGPKMIEIVIPDVENQEADRIWRTLVQAGFMQFRIVADGVKHSSLMELAQADIDAGRIARTVTDTDGKAVGRWVGIGRRYDVQGNAREYRWIPSPANLVRDGRTGRIVDFATANFGVEDFEAFTKWLLDQKIEEPEVLVALDEQNVTGDNLANPRPGIDDRGRPCINFQLSGAGIKKFYQLTSQNTDKPLGIVMDDRLLSAPNINSAISQNGQILGNFTEAEVDEMVNILKSGRLPGTLNKNPVSKDQVDSNIGRQLRESGLAAIGISFLAVMVFMAIYYLRAGVVACIVLLINVALIVALTMLIKFPFSLTSLAGLVLTVGMSVDANVLIFERIREELAKGTTLRMAIQNGFARATATIIDANLTTLLTAIVLYLIGTEHIRGFAVTLILGIVMSLFTAIFCARVMFEIAERQRWLGKLQMLQIFDGRPIDFAKLWPRAAAMSVVLIVAGLGAVVARGTGILSHDLQGGTSARIVLTEATPAEEVRKILVDRFAGAGSFAELGPIVTDGTRHSVEVAGITAEGYENGRVYRIDTSLRGWSGEGEVPADYPQFDQVLQEALSDKLERYQVSFSPVEVKGRGDAAAPAAPSDTPAAPETPSTGETGSVMWPNGWSFVSTPAQEPASDPAAEPTTETPAQETPAEAPVQGDEPATTDAPVTSDEPATTEAPAETPSAPATDTPPAGASEPSREIVTCATTITFSHPITEDGVRQAIRDVAAAKNLAIDSEIVRLTAIADEANAGGARWGLEVDTTDPASVSSLLDGLVDDLNKRPYFSSLAEVGGQIAGDAQVDAVAALVVSLIGIVLYIWIRFQKVAYGIAAVVALVHDVLLVLGAIAVSKWLAPVLGFVLVDNFKISLPVIAAFLTIIGYSLNDTIVVFDRIREMKGKNPKLTMAMVNGSISQTLSRTVLTSLTTLIVVVILYFIGGEAIHAFAFALMVGIFVGTYSSIFIAAPILHWLSVKSNEAA